MFVLKALALKFVFPVVAKAVVVPVTPFTILFHCQMLGKNQPLVPAGVDAEIEADSSLLMLMVLFNAALKAGQVLLPLPVDRLLPDSL